MLQVAFDAAVEAMLIVDENHDVHWANQSSAALLVDGVPIQVMNRNLAGLISFCTEDGQPIGADHPLHPQRDLPSQMGEGRFVLHLSSGVFTPVQQVRWQPVQMLHVPHLLLSIRDLSPEQQALQQQQRFMVDLTHELRTPLAIVSGSLLRLQRDKGLSSRMAAQLTMACEEVNRIHRLLEHLSLMTRLEVDSAWLGLRDQPLFPLLQQWKNQCSDASQKHLVIDPPTGESLSIVRVDANALLLVLDQLLDNALRHGSDSHPVKLQVTRSIADNHCRLELSSYADGPPVEPQDLQNWLMPFSRGLAQRDGSEAEGPGLGLALVSQLVEAWGGELHLNQQLTDTLESKGSVVTMTRVSVSVPLSLEQTN
ncbi:MAG: hypothetical protein CL862_05230 [Cyanobium sp. NAT70]|nr:hypothetical protein [Cyanobium sp. NAT70]